MMLVYKDIIRYIANTDKNYFLCSEKNNKNNKNNKNKIRRKFLYKNKNPLKIKKEIQNDNKWKISLLFSIMIKNIDSFKNKYKQYYEFVNHFLIINSEQDKEDFKATFSKAQRIYNILNRFAYNYKFKKAKIVVNTDMCLNELNEGDKNVISIIQNNSKYLFNVKDLINIISSSLTSSNSFFVNPTKIRNPYNNVAFNKSTLYNIYFFIKFNTNYYSELLYKFFECDFNINIFKLTHEYMLREYIIKNFVYKSASNILINEIIYMIDEFNDLCIYSNIINRIKVDEEFPKERLIKIMQPYLFLFCKALYSYHPLDKVNFLNYFKKGLLRFSNFNPDFGKKECKLVYKTDKNFVQTIVCEKYFNEKHIPFNNIEKQNAVFLTDHLEYENIQSHTINHNNIENQEDDTSIMQEDDTTVTQENAGELDEQSEQDSIS